MDGDVKGYGQYCPISRAVEVLGERWSLLIVRDMLCGFTRFNDLARGLPGLSRSLLVKRLKQLEQAGIVERHNDRYLLTTAGEALRGTVFSLGEWSARWQFGEPRDSELDPQLLVWWMHTRLDFSQLPPASRHVVEFRFASHRERYWILNDSQGPSVCMTDPGFGIDAVVEGDLETLYLVWLGKIPMQTAIRDGAITVSGAPAVTKRMPSVFALSPMAQFVSTPTNR